MVSEDSADTGNSSIRTWGSIAVLVVLLIVMATQFKRIKSSLGKITGGAAETIVVVPKESELKQFDLSKLAAGMAMVAKHDEFNFATPLNSEVVDVQASGGSLSDDELVIGVSNGDTACAFPVAVMRHHLVANAKVGDKMLVVTYSPLTASSAVYLNETGTKFAPTNQIVNNAVLFHDTDGDDNTVYSHFDGVALAGPKKGQKLPHHPHTLTTWGHWKSQHPESKMIKRDPNSGQSYAMNRYSAYLIDVAEPYYPYANKDENIVWKEPVLGVRVGDATKAYPLSALKQAGKPVSDTLAGKKYTIEYHEDVPDQPVAVVTQADEGVQTQPSLWFAWKSFHPQTEIFGK